MQQGVHPYPFSVKFSLLKPTARHSDDAPMSLPIPLENASLKNSARDICSEFTFLCTYKDIGQEEPALLHLYQWEFHPILSVRRKNQALTLIYKHVKDSEFPHFGEIDAVGKTFDTFENAVDYCDLWSWCHYEEYSPTH